MLLSDLMKNSVRYFLRLMISFLARTVYRVRVCGTQNIPLAGPALLVANHVSFIDGFLIATCVPTYVRFLVHEQYYDRFAPFLSLVSAIRVPEGARRSLIKAIELARAELLKGHIVCIFAEGSLTPDGAIHKFQRGFERIVEDLDVPVVPVHVGGLWGSIFSRHPQRSLPRSIFRMPRRVSISFGKALLHPSAAQTRDAVCQLAQQAAEPVRDRTVLSSIEHASF